MDAIIDVPVINISSSTGTEILPHFLKFCTISISAFRKNDIPQPVCHLFQTKRMHHTHCKEYKGSDKKLQWGFKLLYSRNQSQKRKSLFVMLQNELKTKENPRELHGFFKVSMLLIAI